MSLLSRLWRKKVPEPTRESVDRPHSPAEPTAELPAADSPADPPAENTLVSEPTQGECLDAPAERHEAGAEGKICAVCGASCDEWSIQCTKCGSGVFAPAKARRGADEVAGAPRPSVSRAPDLHLVMALSPAIRQKFKDYPPEMAAAIFLAMNDKDRKDLVEKPEGIYISRRCWEKMLSYEIWLGQDGTIIITTNTLGSTRGPQKKDTERFLQAHLPTARRLGRMNSLHYAIGLALTFGLDQNRILLQKSGTEAEIFY